MCMHLLMSCTTNHKFVITMVTVPKAYRCIYNQRFFSRTPLGQWITSTRFTRCRSQVIQWIMDAEWVLSGSYIRLRNKALYPRARSLRNRVALKVKGWVIICEFYSNIASSTVLVGGDNISILYLEHWLPKYQHKNNSTILYHVLTPFGKISSVINMFELHILN